MAVHVLLAVTLLVGSVNAVIDTADCGRTKSCLRSKQGCQDSNQCDLLVMYSINRMRGEVSVEFSVKAADLKWVSLGLNSRVQAMVGTIAVVCIRASNAIGSYRAIVAPNRSTPTWNQYSMNNITSVTGSYTNGALDCKFVRPLNSTHPPQQWSTAPQYVILAYGTRLGTNGLPLKHTGTNITENKIDLSKLTEDKVVTYSSGTMKEPILLFTLLVSIISMLLI